MRGFIGEDIEPIFEETPELEKRTGAPSGFKWRGHEHAVRRVVKEWHEYDQARPGRGGGRPPYATRGVAQRGSWGQGKDFYRVLLGDGPRVDMYYDRRPKGQKRKGRWVIFREIGEAQVEEAQPPGTQGEA
jgi:hypothetical protein